MEIMPIYSVQQSLNLKSQADMRLMSHGGQAADRGMGNQRFDPRQLDHEVRPLDQSAIQHIRCRNPERPFPSRNRPTAGDEVCLKTARIDLVKVLGIRNGSRPPSRLSPCVSTCGLFQVLNGHVLRARRLPMLIRLRVARQATG